MGTKLNSAGYASKLYDNVKEKYQEIINEQVNSNKEKEIEDFFKKIREAIASNKTVIKGLERESDIIEERKKMLEDLEYMEKEVKKIEAKNYYEQAKEKYDKLIKKCIYYVKDTAEVYSAIEKAKEKRENLSNEEKNDLECMEKDFKEKFKF